MKQTWKQIGSLFLSVCMVVTMLPVTAFAETGTKDSGAGLGASGEITAFAALDEDIAVQTVDLGTAENKLNLPKNLAVTVTKTVTTTTGSAVAATVSGDDTATGSEAQKQEQQEETKEITEETTVDVSDWVCDTPYDGDTEGDYTFSPTVELTDGLTLAEGVDAPTVTVTVREEPAVPQAQARGLAAPLGVGESIAINETNFPDANFRTWLLDSENLSGKGANGTLTSDEIASVTTLDVSREDITSLAGLEYFTALTTLNCRENELTTLPELPSGLTWLNCDYNKLNELPALPNSLTQLYCTYNNLTALPELPSSLEWLSCGSNALKTLPELPSSLTKLNCNDNKLTGVTLNGSATYTKIDVALNNMADTGAVTGKSIDWRSVDGTSGDANFIFYPQSTDIPTPAKPLAIPTGLAWDDTTPGKAKWNTVANASAYRVQLFKNGTNQGGDANVDASVTDYDFTDIIAAAGTGNYTFKVQAVGDGINWSDGATSMASAEYNYTPGGGTGTVTGTMDIGGTTHGNLTLSGRGTGWTWNAANATLTLDSTYVSSNAIFINCATTDTINLVYSDNVHISVASAAFNSNGALNINGSGTLTLENTTTFNPALQVMSGELNISGGTLNATGPTGIYSHSGNIRIGGNANVTAVSTGNIIGASAGISAIGYDVIITGGTVNATGIGTGQYDGALIADNITITGGDVNLFADIPANYAIADGGVLTVSNPADVKIGGTPVYLATLTLDGVKTETALTAVTSPTTNYGIASMTTGADGKLYFLLPAGSQTVTLIAGVYTHTGTINVTNNHGATATLASQVIPTIATISGTIKGNDTNNGINGATVQLKNTSGGLLATSTTNPSGQYTFNNLVAGTYSIEASAPGYSSGTISSIVLGTANISGKDLTLTKTGDTTTYAVTVNGSYASPTGAGSYAKDTTVSIYAGNRSNYTFTGWTSSDVSITSASDKNASFVMPNKAVTVTANWSYNGGGGGNGGGSSSGGSSDSTTTTTPEKKPDQPVTASAPVTATAGQNGAASASIPEKSVTDAIAKAQADAKAQGKIANGTTVALNVTMPKGATSLTTNLTRNSLNSLVSAGVTSLELNGSPVTVSFETKALAEIQKQSSGNISITIAPNAKLSATAKTMIGTRPVYDLTVNYTKDGKNGTVSSFGGGTATVSVPYTPAKGEAIGGLYAVYVDASGNATRIAGSAYDANSGCVMFSTTHFSLYGIGYTAPSAKFADITTHWGKESIDYVVGRGLLSGTTETTFAPDTTMTRGMLVTALGRLANVDTKAYSTNSFTDVKEDSAFRPYIEWAYKKGVVQGTGNGKFEPDRAITREEIAVIFTNFAKATGYTLPVTRTATTYADASSIGSTYKTAVTAMQQAGIMMGGSGNKFNPKSSATRAEVSSMLHRYIKLTIDPATAQGWALNDAGQYLYYKNSKALTGTQTISGTKYFFNTDGTLKTGWVKDDAGNWRFYSGNTMLVGFGNLGANGNNKTYYFNKDGIMVAGKWLEIEGKWYYFNADGSLAKSTKIDGYEVDSNGVRKD